jgi:uncharacterized protein with FMN-binding domain
MGATKATLIVVGTVTGLGAVLAYQPPHQTLKLGGSGGGLMGGGTTPPPSSTPTQAVVTPTATPTPSTEPTQAATTPPAKTPAPHKTTAKPVTPKKTKAPTPKSINGTFTGATSNTVYGPVQVQIDVKGSKIVAVRAIQLPTGTAIDAQIDAQAIPILTSETLAAQSADIQGVSGASYTSQGWYDSLVSALSKAGL